MVNLLDARKGDIAVFRCGGTVPIREIRDIPDSEHYPISVKLEGYHAGDNIWTYTNEGEHGESTGPGKLMPFDIVEIIMKPKRKP